MSFYWGQLGHLDLGHRTTGVLATEVWEQKAGIFWLYSGHVSFGPTRLGRFRHCNFSPLWGTNGMWIIGSKDAKEKVRTLRPLGLVLTQAAENVADFVSKNLKKGYSVNSMPQLHKSYDSSSFSWRGDTWIVRLCTTTSASSLPRNAVLHHFHPVFLLTKGSFGTQLASTGFREDL